MKKNGEGKLYAAHSLAEECCGSDLTTIHWVVTERWMEDEYVDVMEGLTYAGGCRELFEKGLFLEHELTSFQNFMEQKYGAKIFIEVQQPPFVNVPMRIVSLLDEGCVMFSSEELDLPFSVSGYYDKQSICCPVFSQEQKIKDAEQFFLNVLQQLKHSERLDTTGLRLAVHNACGPRGYLVRKSS